MSMLLAWILSASAALAPSVPYAYDGLAQAIASRVQAEPPLFPGDDDRRRSAAVLVAIGFRESALRADAVGDMRGGRPTSFCAFQVHVPPGTRTTEGWTGEELAADPDKCVSAALRMVRLSMKHCPKHPLAWYASGFAGCTSERAQRISADRMNLAQWLVLRVPPPERDVVSWRPRLEPLDRPRRVFATR